MHRRINPHRRFVGVLSSDVLVDFEKISVTLANCVFAQTRYGVGKIKINTAATRAEPGNLDFVALRGTEDPDAFVLYERYSSRAAFEAHTASPHYEGIAVAQIRPLLSDRTVEFCQVVEPDGS